MVWGRSNGKSVEKDTEELEKSIEKIYEGIDGLERDYYKLQVSMSDFKKEVKVLYDCMIEQEKTKIQFSIDLITIKGKVKIINNKLNKIDLNKIKDQQIKDNLNNLIKLLDHVNDMNPRDLSLYNNDKKNFREYLINLLSKYYQLIISSINEYNQKNMDRINAKVVDITERIERQKKLKLI